MFYVIAGCVVRGPGQAGHTRTSWPRVQTCKAELTIEMRDPVQDERTCRGNNAGQSMYSPVFGRIRSRLSRCCEVRPSVLTNLHAS